MTGGGSIVYEITGCAAHTRLKPLLSDEWIDESPYGSGEKEEKMQIDFLWENCPRFETRSYRDNVRCYSHLPNGTAVLDSKWALAYLMSSLEKSNEELAVLPSYCFRGSSGFRRFCAHVEIDATQSSIAAVDRSQFPDIFYRNGLQVNLPSEPTNLWVVKDAGANGAGGIWIVGPENARHFGDEAESPLIEEHRYIAQKYAWPPVLFQGRKCHVRVYGLLTSDGRAFIHRRCFLHVANEPFEYGSANREGPIFEPSVHITNCCANSHNKTKFAGEICADLQLAKFGRHTPDGQPIIPLSDFFPSISASISTLAKRSFPFLRGGEANNGFEYLGVDFILSYRGSSPIAYLLEVNAPPSQDTATGLAHAEGLHNDVMRDIVTLWVEPRVAGAEENPGGWMCVHKEEGYLHDKHSETAIVPSKAAIINKIRWAIYERKTEKQMSLQTLNHARGLQSTLPTPDMVADSVAGFARSLFPFFRSKNATNEVFFENAGGAQVPSQVIDAISSSLSKRNRVEIGSQTKQAARQTICSIVGANEEDYAVFLGANATSLLDLLAERYREAGHVDRGNEIIVCTENHLSNCTPWLKLARSVGAEVKWWTITDYNGFSPECQCSADLEQLLSPRTRLVALSHASNVLGNLRDVHSIARMVKERTNGMADVVVDGVAAVPHVFADVAQSDALDWYVISCHKLFGPHLGALCALNTTAKRVLGAPDCQSKLMELGTISYEACAGVVGIGRYFQTLGLMGATTDPALQNKVVSNHSLTQLQSAGDTEDGTNEMSAATSLLPIDRDSIFKAYTNIHLAEQTLSEVLCKRLSESQHVRLIQDAGKHRLPLVSFKHQRIPSDCIVAKCKECGISCRSSTFLCCDQLKEEFASLLNGPLDCFVRLSLAHYNKKSEIEFVMSVLESIPQWF